jgi:BirA family biotin operon repressor/biotin-[acetyl-CoA-carboxylase] ligase
VFSPREEWSLDTRRLGRRVLVYDRVDSTNSVAARLADDPANDGLALVSDEQTAGRGQHGRTWLADAGQSVLLSLIVSPPPYLCRPAVLTAWAAVAVCETIQQTIGTTSRIKWPNDVLLQERKVCGILIESANAKSFIVGIGLNVRQSAETFVAAGLPVATALAQFSDRPLETYAVAADLIRHLDRAYERLCLGDLAELERRWQGLLGLLGQDVIAVCSDNVHRGRLLDLSFDGVELVPRGERRLRLVPERIWQLSLAEQANES